MPLFMTNEMSSILAGQADTRREAHFEATTSIAEVR